MAATVTPAPLASGLPLIGSLIPVMQDSVQFFRQEYQRRGPVFRVRVLNNQFTVIAGLTAAELMTSNEEGTLSGWETWQGVASAFGASKTLGMLEGAPHAQHRRVMRNSMSKSHILGQIPLVVQTMREILATIPVGTRVNVVDFTQRITATVLGKVALGRAPGDYLDDFVTYWHGVLKAHFVHTMSVKTLNESPVYQQARGRVMELVQRIIAEHRDGTHVTGESTLADDLIAEMQADPTFLDEDDLPLAVLVPYIAGLDTVANITFFMLYEIHRAPALHERLLGEIRPLFANGAVPTAEQVRKLELTHATAMEAMRLYNVAPTLLRTAARDFEVGGYHVAKGEPLMMMPGMTHWLSEFYPNPDAFDIDRFFPPRSEHKRKGAFAPYGAGSHTCLGAGLAEAQLALMIITLLNDAGFEIDPPTYRHKRFVSAELAPDRKFFLKRTS